MTKITCQVVRYGSHRDQVADLVFCQGRRKYRGTVLLLHGGFWKDRYRRDLMDDLAVYLAGKDIVVVNLEYRRVTPEETNRGSSNRLHHQHLDGGRARGRVTETLGDVTRGLACLGDIPKIDPRRVFVVGHSAGGQLALWLAAWSKRKASSRILPRAVFALAPVSDLAEGMRLGLGKGAVARFLGSDPRSLAQRVRKASPLELLPLGVPQYLVHGTRDRTVPIRMSRRYVYSARVAGDEAALVEVPGGHMDLIDPRTDAWRAAEMTLDACMVECDSLRS